MGDWILHFDGLYEPRSLKTGLATYGFQATHEGRIEGEGHGIIAGPGGPLASANIAEFGALIQGLAWLREHKRDTCPVLVRGDSQLVIETVAGRWNLTSEILIPLRDTARAIAKEIGVSSFEKVSREENAEADRLSRLAYHENVALRRASRL